MKLTNKTEYAILALLTLAREKANTTSIQTIAKKAKIPARFLEQIMLHLKHGQFVKSIRGQKGGYQLNKKLEEISLAEIIRYFEGALAPTESVSKFCYSETPLTNEKSVVSVMKDIRDYISSKLEKTTLADLI
jgi:Rrf2 family cysteine metabolism transcriptional repressor